MNRAEHYAVGWRVKILVVLLDLFLFFHLFSLFLMMGAIGLSLTGAIDISEEFRRRLLVPALAMFGFVATFWIVARVNRRVNVLVALVGAFLFLDLLSVVPKIDAFIRPFLSSATDSSDDLPPLDFVEPVIALISLLGLVGIFWIVRRVNRLLLKHLANWPQSPAGPMIGTNG